MMSLSQDQKSIPNHQQLTFDTYQLGIIRHYGKTLPLFIKPNGQPRYLLGPHYYVFMLTLLITTIIYIYLATQFYPAVSTFHFICIVITGVIYICMYVKVGFSVPGIASSGMQPDLQTKLNPKYCIPCKIIKENGTKHCLFCDVCIYNLDHHCPWVGKCVGRDNLCTFYLFIFSVILLFLSLFLGAVFGKITTQ